MKRRLLNLAGIAVIGLTIGWLCGCTNWERQAFQALAAAQKTIDGAHEAYEASASDTCPVPANSNHPCLPHTAKVHDVVEKAIAADNTAVDALVAYEKAKAAGQGQAALQVAQTDVETALAALPGLIADIKALYAKGQ